LHYYDPKLPIIVETDIYNFIIDAVLSQEDEEFPSVAFHSRKITTTKLNYDIYEIDILAIVTALKE
jgi:hypothetical protein